METVQETRGYTNATGFAWLLLVLSALLYYFDWINLFNGLNFSLISSNANILFRSGVLIFAAILFIFQYFTTEQKTKEDVISMILLSFVFAIVFIVGAYNSMIIWHIVFAVITWVFLTKGSGMSIREANGWIIFLLLADLFLFSGIEQIATMAGNEIIAARVAYRLIFPIYSLFFIFYLAGKGEKLAFIFLIIILLIYIFGFVKTSDIYNQKIEQLTLEERQSTVDFFKNSLAGMSRGFASLFDPLGCASYVGGSKYQDCINDRQIARQCNAEGYKKGQIEYNECNKEKKEGGGTTTGIKDQEDKHYTQVQFKKIDRYKVGINPKEKVITGIQVDSKFKPIDIVSYCSFTKDGKTIAGIMVVGQEFTDIKGVESLELACEPAFNYEKGKYYYQLTSTIQNINTRSIKKKIWVEQDIDEEIKTNILQTEGLNAIEDKSKSDDNFAALAISLGPDDSILSNRQTTQLLKAKIQNLGEGNIERIDDILIEIPTGIEPLSDCFEFLEETPQGYRMKKSLIVSKSESAKNLKKDEKLNAFNCQLDVSGVVNPIDHNVRTLVAYMDYSYKIKQKMSVEAI